MYKIGDTVLYGHVGVCKITEIVSRKIKDVEHHYYSLSPLDQKLTVLVPIDSITSKKMQPILSKEMIYELIKAMPNNETIWINDKNVRKQKYHQIINSGDHQQLVKLIKTLYLNKQ